MSHTKNQRHGEQEMIPNSSHEITSLAHLEKQSGLQNELRGCGGATLGRRGRRWSTYKGAGVGLDPGLQQAPPLPPARMVVGRWVGETLPVNLSGNNLRELFEGSFEGLLSLQY